MTDAKLAGEELATHPDADIYPMLSGDELAALAADIKQNGLRFPIVLDADGKTLIDGRNRLKACELAGVEPRFERLNGEDPKAFIVSANLARRDLTKGQKAIALAMHYPESTAAKGGRGKKDDAKNLEETSGFSHKRLQQARTILAYSPDIAHAILAGAQLFDAALEYVKAEQSKLTSAESQLALLREEAPDLADLVAEERLPLSEAYSAYEKRKSDEAAKKANQRETILRLSEAAYRGAGAWAVDEFAAGINEELCADEDFRAQFIARLRINSTELEDIQRGAKRLAGIISNLIKKGSAS